MREGMAWAKLRAQFPSDAHITRIENRLGGGVADTNICWRRLEYWVEGKVLREKDLTQGRYAKIKWRKFQIPWLVARAKAGGRVAVWIYCDWLKEYKVVTGNFWLLTKWLDVKTDYWKKLPGSSDPHEVVEMLLRSIIPEDCTSKLSGNIDGLFRSED